MMPAVDQPSPLERYLVLVEHGPNSHIVGGVYVQAVGREDAVAKVKQMLFECTFAPMRRP